RVRVKVKVKVRVNGTPNLSNNAFVAPKNALPLYALLGRLVAELPTLNEQVGNVVKANVWTGARVSQWIQESFNVAFARTIVIGTSTPLISLLSIHFPKR